ncbi:cytochrome c oxidase subunit II [Halocatena marina]|uniref:cytochrome c oxidase subunit II n=1 Tax=Halocatena marina TaxID=2934937 RepID=UPI00200E4CF9|nr:cytochrome c oxidase subunit II [Halocatena marina]
MSPISGIGGLIARRLLIGSNGHIVHVLQTTDLKTMHDIFSNIFRVFLILGTLVGVVVISYMVYNAFKYRENVDEQLESESYTELESKLESDVDRPQLGELPSGSGGGKKLGVSFFFSAVIVISLIVWTYGLLMDVEGGPPDTADQIEVKVVGQQFSWQFIYPNGHTSSTLRVPEGKTVRLSITSRDVFHNFGISAFDLKADAIPGQTTDTWFQPQETGTYQAKCFELCGEGHSTMESEVIVMKPDKFDKWYAGTKNSTQNKNSPTNTTAASHAIGDVSVRAGTTVVR